MGGRRPPSAGEELLRPHTPPLQLLQVPHRARTSCASQPRGSRALSREKVGRHQEGHRGLCTAPHPLAPGILGPKRVTTKFPCVNL